MDDRTNDRRQRATEEAAEWWIRLKRDDVPRQQREQFVDWLRESPIHVAEMLRIAQVEGALEQFQGWTGIATEGSDDNNVIELPAGSARVESTPNTSRQRRWSIVGSLAASVAVIAVATTWFVTTLGVIETDRGERREVALADGSVLQISPETRLRVTLDERERRVTLDRGAALFKVAKDSARPFTVTADDTVVRAVGTAFGVEHRTQAIVVTVSEGRVQVAARRAASTSGASGLPSPAPLLLRAGEQIAVPPARAADGPDASRISAAHVRQVDTARELAWADGRLVFDQRNVADVIVEFNRYNRVQLRVTDPALAQRPISGVFDANDPESFIAFIATVAPVRIERDHGKEITLTAP